MADEVDKNLTGEQPKPIESGLSAYEQAQRDRESKISFAREQPDFNVGRSNAGGGYTADQSARESRLASRPDFNTPFRTDQSGRRTAVGPAAQFGTVTPSVNVPFDVRSIMDKGGRLTEGEERRLSQFRQSTKGKQLAKLYASLQKVKRDVGGEKEKDRQLSEAQEKGFMDGGLADLPGTRVLDRPEVEDVQVPDYGVGEDSDLDTDVAMFDSESNFDTTPSTAATTLLS